MEIKSVLQAAEYIENELNAEGYCGQRIGSGCTTAGNPVRDVQFYLSSKVPTQEVINKMCPKGYIAELKLRDDNFSIYVQAEPSSWEQQLIESRKKNVATDGRDMFNEVWVDVTEKYKTQIAKCLVGAEENRFSLGYVANVVSNEVGQTIPEEHRHLVLHIHGGKNGNGKWNYYLVDALSIFNKLKDKDLGAFSDVYLIKWDVDVADDVFYMWIGVRE